MILRIVAVLVLIGLIVAGYLYIKDWKQDKLEAEYRKYAAVVTETSLAAELYRNDNPRFLTVRDSILTAHAVTREEMLTLVEKFRTEKWVPADFWKFVSEMTDSVVRVQDSVLKIIQKDSTTSLFAPAPDSSDST